MLYLAWLKDKEGVMKIVREDNTNKSVINMVYLSVHKQQRSFNQYYKI